MPAIWWWTMRQIQSTWYFYLFSNFKCCTILNDSCRQHWLMSMGSRWTTSLTGLFSLVSTSYDSTARLWLRALRYTSYTPCFVCTTAFSMKSSMLAREKMNRWLLLRQTSFLCCGFLSHCNLQNCVWINLSIQIQFGDALILFSVFVAAVFLIDKL